MGLRPTEYRTQHLSVTDIYHVRNLNHFKMQHIAPLPVILSYIQPHHAIHFTLSNINSYDILQISCNLNHFKMQNSNSYVFFVDSPLSELLFNLSRVFCQVVVVRLMFMQGILHQNKHGIMIFHHSNHFKMWILIMKY